MSRVQFRNGIILPLIATLVAVSTSAHAQSDAKSDPPFRVEREALQFELSGAEHHMRVDNPHGDIRIRAGELDKVEILVVKQIIGEHPTAPTLTTSIEAKNSTIRVRYPRRPKPFYGRIDLVIYLPPETHVTLTTVDSTIQVKGWQGSIEARSKSGRITADGHGQLRLRSGSGRILAGLFEGKRIADSRIQTRSGSINVSVEKATSALVLARTCGDLESLSDSLQSVSKGRCKKARAMFSAGAHTVDVRSRTGAVMVNAM